MNQNRQGLRAANRTAEPTPLHTPVPRGGGGGGVRGGGSSLMGQPISELRQSRDRLPTINSRVTRPSFAQGGRNQRNSNQKGAKPAESWSQDEVKKWLQQNNIDQNFAKKLTPCSGADLKQLLEMKNIAPEFFYQALYQLRSINELKPILKFSGCLESLPFKNKE